MWMTAEETDRYHMDDLQVRKLIKAKSKPRPGSGASWLGFQVPSIPGAACYICKLELSLLVLVRVGSDLLCNQKHPDTEGQALLRKAQQCPGPGSLTLRLIDSTSLHVQQASGTLLSVQPRHWDRKHARHPVSLWALEIQLRPAGLYGKHLTNDPSSTFTHLGCVYMLLGAKLRASRPPGKHIPAPRPDGS